MKIFGREIEDIGVVIVVGGIILVVAGVLMSMPKEVPEELPVMLAADSIVLYLADGTEREISLDMPSLSLYYGDVKVIGMMVRFRATPYYKEYGVVDTTKYVLLNGSVDVKNWERTLASYATPTNADGSTTVETKSGTTVYCSYYEGYPGPITEGLLRTFGLGDGEHVFTWVCHIDATSEELTTTSSATVKTTIRLNTVSLRIDVEQVEIITA